MVNEIIDFLGNRWECECIGCAIRDGKLIPPGGIIYESESFVVEQDPEIPINGFLIVSSKKHIKSIIELSENERHELIDLVDLSIRAIKDLDLTDEVTIVQEERSEHLHFWVFPHSDWMDERFGKGISYLRAINSYVRENISPEDKDMVLETVEEIKKYFEKNIK